jgi:hypothetical protein
MARPHLRLSRILVIDAMTCTAMGALLVAAAPFVGRLTGIPAPLLFWAGALLLPIAAFMAIIARMTPVPTWAANVVVIGNALWVLVSLALPLTGAITPNALGWLFLLAQAAVVGALAILEFGSKPRAALA